MINWVTDNNFFQLATNPKKNDSIRIRLRVGEDLKKYSIYLQISYRIRNVCRRIAYTEMCICSEAGQHNNKQ